VLQGFLACLVVNTALLVGVSLLVRPVGRDREQADAFVLGAEPAPPSRRTPADAARIEELRQLLARFVGVERAARTLSGELSLQTALARTERMLSGTLGAASARVIVAASVRRGRLLTRSARAIIDEASEAIRYNYEILRNTLDHVGMGIAAFDREGRLEIFNDRFTALLALDDAAVAVGAAPREFGATQDVVDLLRRPASPQTHEIATRDGRVIELRLDPLPEDGFVATCNDVTARVRTAEALRDSDGQLRRAAETLEQRVAERTAELEASRAEAEAANLGKTRFIAAASHDLLQPLHAARLFTAAMIDRDPRNDLGGKIDASLGAVESLLDALLDISKLDAGAFKPEKRPFALQPLFDSLATAFAPTAARRGVELVVVPTQAFVDTDPSFLRRILQNLLSNALRYGQVEGRPARVLLGCRRVGGSLRIEVRDNGPGIAPDKQAIIFDEFVRLQPEDEGRREERGLGLGLAIVDRIARMLDLPVALASAPGRGSTFSITVPRVAGVLTAPSAAPAPQPMPSIEAESFVLCLDNEAQVREAMAALLGGWGCRVATAASQAEALDAVARAGRLPDLVLADLHLDEGANGLDVVAALRQAWGRNVQAALVTADRDPTLRVRARARQVELLHKPVKPASLRALLRLRSAAAGRLTA
jgi:signal transduction histidine kinase/CheY-like chemotaxis protein